MDFKICDNNCTNNVIEQLEYLKLLVSEILECSFHTGDGEWLCTLEQDFIDELRKAVC